MKIVYLINDTLTEEELTDVSRHISLTPVIGALVLAQKGVRVAQDLDLDVVHCFNWATDDALEEAQRITEASDRPVAVITASTEPVKEIECLSSLTAVNSETNTSTP